MYQTGSLSEEEIGLGTKLNEYKKVLFKGMVKEEYSNSKHAAHCMIYAANTRLVLNVYETKYSILMQLRFDGHLGFPGGVVDEGETPEEAVAREMEEEMGLLRKDFQVLPEDHVVSHYSEEKDLFLHFFTKELSLSKVQDIEVNAIKNNGFGDEVMGLVRVPLYTMSDGFRGLPAFLTNAFAGNSKQQLCYALVENKIMTSGEIDTALAAKPTYIDRTSK